MPRDTLSRDHFNQAVIAHLEQTGREDIAERSEEMDRSISAMSSATVARHEELPLARDSVVAIADLREQWVRDAMVDHETESDR